MASTTSSSAHSTPQTHSKASSDDGIPSSPLRSDNSGERKLNAELANGPSTIAPLRASSTMPASASAFVAGVTLAGIGFFATSFHHAGPLVMASVAAAGVWFAGYVRILSLFMRGELGPLQPRHAPYAWLLCLSVLSISHVLTVALVDDSQRVPCPQLTLGGADADLLPVVAFTLLLVSEGATVLFAWCGAEGAEMFAYVRQPVLAVHGASLLYYSLAASRRLVCLPDAFGRPFAPLRTALWLGSISSMVASVYFVVDQRLLVLAWQLGERAEAEADGLQRNVRHGFVGVLGTVGFGLLASWPWPRPSASALPLLNVLFLVGSWGSFYVMLHQVVTMLGRIEILAGNLHHDRHSMGAARQFRVIRHAVIASWHGFGIVWVLAACQVISPHAEQGGFIFCDLIAKYVLMFVYVAQGGVAHTKG